MKKLFFIMIAISAVMMSCTEYNGGFSKSEMMFDMECNKALGITYTNQNWGFGNMNPVLIAETRTVNTNSNMWEDQYKLQVPDEITDDEKEYVKNWFATNRYSEGSAIHWSDFFIQYVSSYNEQTGTSQRNMDLLGYESIDGRWEHVNNFNTQTHATQYVYDAGTENWTYRSSFDDKYHNDKYIVQYLSFDVNGKHYEGWYVGFDYEAYVYEGDGSLRQGSVFADGYYDDWIVKVTPGTKQDYPVTSRVMCEDLGNSYDWDYNDVVFDVSYEETWWPEHKLTAIITLRASGGTMPVYVGIHDERYETHKLFGYPSNVVLINPSTPVIYRVDVQTTNPKDIPIYVNNTEAVYILKAEKTPQKFCCPNIVKWSGETVDIRGTYPKWSGWVNDNSIKFWE